MVQISRRAVMLLGMLLGPPLAHAAEAPPPLSPAQIALFETPHLARITDPLRLDYTFRREEAGHPAVTDQISLDIRRIRDDGRHDVYADFLTGERHIAYPPAMGFLGNPLLIFALDRDTRELSAATGGSRNWFRGRFRAALLDGATLRQGPVAAAGQPAPVEATTVEVTPFQNEKRAGRFQSLRYVFILSEAVPGGIVEIRSAVPDGPDGPAITESITFSGARAP
ncbi:hypothetical protein [Roseomonas marmotae]|uniref:DUF3108 domain-containing protein n=1 Tax=Roseomonas marmotae TaxID=2768161 RepID=A0ABS3KDJ9_9PROT|nr:hypothetical protein [Roseomonas marmotae]MBO1075554.1 hypothetical protein [Roseomonas marmotae]QTI81543.1 hypothetical protein IAI58_19595 [Roseomonas marmotae]